ncbi:hypothetical protein Nmel_011470 [Mimus melanotis]
MSWHKGKKELTEESAGDGKHGRKTRERLFKKRFSRLSLFSGSPKNKFPQGRTQLADDKRRCLSRPGSRRPKAAREEPCSLRQPGALQRSGPMCPSCEIRLPQGRTQLADDKRRCLSRPGSRRPKAAREEPCSLRQPGALQRSGPMCPSCEIRLCRRCGTLHSQRGFIAHSLLDHYDPAALPR